MPKPQNRSVSGDAGQQTPRHLLRELCGFARSRHYKRGQVVFHQGDTANSLYLVRSGFFEVSTLSGDGRKQSLNVLRKGDFFGEIALLDGGSRSAAVAAMENGRLLQIARRDLMNALVTHPELGLRLLSLTVERLRWVIAQQEDQAFQPMEVRLARRLLYLDRILADDSGVIHLSQNDLAEHIGVSREAAAKCLADWQRKGMVKLGRRRISVTSSDSLREMADTKTP